jgi:hypothetical protein
MIDNRPDYSKVRLTASKAIRLKCLDCCGENMAEVTRCHIVKCPLWRWRSGKEQRDSLYVNNRPINRNPKFLRTAAEKTALEGEA